MTPTLTKNYRAGAAIAPRRLVTVGDADGVIVQASAQTSLPFGVSDELGAESGARADAHRAGIAEVEYGGNIARGQLVTADADGRAVVANPGEAESAHVFGVAEVSGVAGDVGSILIAPSRIDG